MDRALSTVAVWASLALWGFWGQPQGVAILVFCAHLGGAFMATAILSQPPRGRL